jgi:hypothetical protein
VSDPPQAVIGASETDAPNIEVTLSQEATVDA